MDLEGMNVRDMPISWVKAAMGSLAQNYKCMGYATYILNTVFTVRMIWNILKPFLDERIKRKIIFSKNSNDCEELIEWFHPTQLEVKFGGEAPDIEEYWPPTMPDSDEYGVDPQKLEEKKEPPKVEEVKHVEPESSVSMDLGDFIEETKKQVADNNVGETLSGKMLLMNKLIPRTVGAEDEYKKEIKE